MLFKLLVVALLLGILASLASGLFFLIRDQGQTKRTLNSLTLRIALSLALFALLIIGYFNGWIQPHGITP